MQPRAPWGMVIPDMGTEAATENQVLSPMQVQAGDGEALWGHCLCHRRADFRLELKEEEVVGQRHAQRSRVPGWAWGLMLGTGATASSRGLPRVPLTPSFAAPGGGGCWVGRRSLETAQRQSLSSRPDQDVARP